MSRLTPSPPSAAPASTGHLSGSHPGQAHTDQPHLPPRDQVLPREQVTPREQVFPIFVTSLEVDMGVADGCPLGTTVAPLR